LLVCCIITYWLICIWKQLCGVVPRWCVNVWCRFECKLWIYKEKEFNAKHSLDHIVVYHDWKLEQQVLWL
jgi:hypothetical protein